MTYNYKENKIVAIINKNTATWQALNVLGHMSISLGANKDNCLMGRDILIDKTGYKHKGIAKWGFIIKQGDSDSIYELINKVKDNNTITLINFTQEMLDTRHDDDLFESMKEKGIDEFNYLGCLIYGKTKDIDMLTKDYVLWG